MKELIITLIILAYLIIGVMLSGAIPSSSGEPMKSMVFLWAIYIPILAVAGIFNIAFIAGEHIRAFLLTKTKLRKKEK